MERNTLNAIIARASETISRASTRSAWARGVRLYVYELVDSIGELAEYYGEVTPDNVESVMLNGAEDWAQYSLSGCSEIYNADIAARLCNRAEWRRSGGGRKAPNSRESWLDIQAKALNAAAF